MAQGQLLVAGLNPGSIRSVFDCDNIRIVISQVPYPGTQVAAGTVVNLWVGTNHDPSNPRRVCP